MNNNPEINNILGEIDKAINDETVSLSRVIALASRRAAAKMNQLIDSPNEHVALKASSDLLDRAPETSKTFKGVLTNFNFSPEDSRELAMALVASAKAKEKYLPIATGDFVKVDTNQESGNGKEEAGPPEGS